MKQQSIWIFRQLKFWCVMTMTLGLGLGCEPVVGDESLSLRMVYEDAAAGKRFELKHASREGDVMVFEGHGVSLRAKHAKGEGYDTLRILSIHGGDAAASISLHGENLTMVPLDFMTVRHKSGSDVHWPWSMGDVGENPLGGVAIFSAPDDEVHDETLLRIWVREGLPHPPGEWTLERARRWLTEWQEKFADQSCMVAGAKNRAELDKLTEWAKSIGMKRIYLHTDTWRGEYWPVKYSFLNVNREVFPRGEEDLTAYAESLAAAGMSIAIHGTCISIAREDADYVKPHMVEGLDTWVQGTLIDAVSDADTTLRIQSVPGSARSLPPYLDDKLFRVGNEFILARATEVDDAGVWTLQGCRRGAWATKSNGHAAGTPALGMVRPYGQCLVPDPDHPLLIETIDRWATFLRRNKITHIECDALEIHCGRPWGAQKFCWLLASRLDVPTTSNTSNGNPLTFHIEYWFRSSETVYNNHAFRGVAGGASTPLIDHSPARMATGPYEIYWKPGEMVADGGQSMNLSYPWPMFGITPGLLETHGLVNDVAALFEAWREILPLMSDSQRKRMGQEYRQFRSPTGGASNQSGTDVLFRPRKTDAGFEVEPVRMIGRASGELNWGYGQEFGPIVPRQYLQLGESLDLVNREKAQGPEILLRVMGTAGSNPEQEDDEVFAKENDVVASYETGTTHERDVHPLNAARHIWDADYAVDGFAAAGEVVLRKIFAVKDASKVRRARLYLQADDFAVARFNHKKVFAGGRFDQVLFVDLPKLKNGHNYLEIRATNQGGPGMIAATIHLETDDGLVEFPSDRSWQGKGKDGAWKAVADLGVYGSGPWPQEIPTPLFISNNLMPQGVLPTQAAGHHVAFDGDHLKISTRNNGMAVKWNVEHLPGWDVNIDMSKATGIACTIDGDGSGALLLVRVVANGNRVYAIPIDFKGEREIEIPSGEVCWGDPNWSWRHEARMAYETVRQVEVGFGMVPAGSAPSVNIVDLRPISMLPCEVADLTVAYDDTARLKILAPVPSHHYVWYRGGDTAGLYDLNWNKVTDLPVESSAFEVPKGATTLNVGGKTAVGHEPWIEFQSFVTGESMMITSE